MTDYLEWLMTKYSFEKIEKIDEGWSMDEKYRVTGSDYVPLLLRISDRNHFNEKKQEFDRIKQFNQFPSDMSQAIYFNKIPGTDKLYMLLTYIEGNNLEQVLPTLSMEEQYQLGVEAGDILRGFHQLAINVDEIVILRELRNKKLYQLELFLASKYVSLPKVTKIVKYIQDNSFNMLNQRVSLLHGDFHPNNLIYTKNKQVGVIDFNRSDIGDPYEEFYKLQMFGKESSVPFAKGAIIGYFEGKVPEEFWDMQKFYVFHASLFSVIWADNNFPDDVEEMIGRLYQNLADYDDGRLLVPKWWH